MSQNRRLIYFDPIEALKISAVIFSFGLAIGALATFALRHIIFN